MSQELFRATKDPQATLDFVIDWAEWLDADAIAAATWTIPAGLVKVNESHDGAKATVWLSGGTGDVTYRCACRIETTAGRIDERSIWVRVLDL